jgi:hypothetical protein
MMNSNTNLHRVIKLAEQFPWAVLSAARANETERIRKT